MTGPPVRRPREDGVTLAYQRLRADVLAGRLEPGQVLSQVQLASSLGIGRGPLREALRRLIAEGLVVGDFNQKMRVSELDLADVDQIYAMRIALEPLGVAATVPSLSPDDRARLHSSVEAMDAAADAGDLEAFRGHHRDFHLGLTARAGPRLHGALTDLWDHSERYRLNSRHHDAVVPRAATAERLRVSQGEHRDILAAALAGEAGACSQALVAHLQQTLEGVVTSPLPR